MGRDAAKRPLRRAGRTLRDLPGVVPKVGGRIRRAAGREEGPMKLTFLGTRGTIRPRTDRHRRHTSLLVQYRGKRVMIDCGETWAGRLGEVDPDAILITHPHPDHAFALREEEPPCPVHAAPDAWEKMEEFAPPRRFQRSIQPRRRKRIEGITFEAFPVIHSLRAPAVGYRITAGRASVFYVPDVVWIRDRAEALRDVHAYIGDGATIHRNMVRKEKRSGRLIGHATVTQQLTWCRKERVPRMIVTHCGADIVANDERTVGARLRRLARERDVEVEIAHDGMEREFG